MNERNDRLSREFGKPVHRREHGGGYDVESGSPQVRRREIRGEQITLLGGKPNKPAYYYTELPEMAPILHISNEEKRFDFSWPTNKKKTAWEVRQSVWVTLGVRTDDAEGVIYDSGYWHTIVWYEWREEE